MAIYNPALQVFLIPLWDHSITLREGMRRLLSIGNDPGEVPFLVKIMENPAFDLPPLSMFRGRVTLEQHDCVHLLLGRGTTLYDEAFTIGFTMGSSKEMSSAATRWFAAVAGRWYPKPYRFPKSARRIFTDAVHLGAVSDCKPLDHVNFGPLMDFTIQEVRQRLGIEEELLQAYYNVEAARNSKITACRRLHKE